MPVREIGWCRRLTDRGVGVGGWVDIGGHCWLCHFGKPVGVWVAGTTLEELWAMNSWKTRQRERVGAGGQAAVTASLPFSILCPNHLLAVWHVTSLDGCC